MILIIDDDNSIRASLSFMLKRARYETTAVASPKEAMAIVRATEPQLILMDMNFSLTTSGDEGLTLLRQVKLFRPHVPVILMTAWGSIELAVKGMKAGAFDFITKPWNNAMLLQRIETALELKSIENGNSVIENSELGMENYDYSCSSKPSSTTELHILPCRFHLC
jgi:two-component system NtrC family response regulator